MIVISAIPRPPVAPDVREATWHLPGSYKLTPALIKTFPETSLFTGALCKALGSNRVRTTQVREPQPE